MPISTKEFIASLVESGLMTLEEIEAVQKSLPQEEQAQDLMALARELVKRRKLTKYQAGRIYQGRSKGLVVGNYVLLDKIGEGGMGEVFKAEHRRMKRVVAIKMLPPNMMESEKAIKRFQREVEAGAKLVHPNIVTAFDADEHQGVHYLVMEFVDGQNLAAVVAKQGPLSVEKAVSCIVQAAKGLSFAHKQGIIHRDIKPHNLLIDKAGVVKILDMGLVRFESSGDGDSIVRTKLTYQDQIVGTVDYMSPEQADDTSSVDQRADIYSLGCTMYRLLTGRPPYDGESTIQKLLAHREYAVPSLRVVRTDVPPELDLIYQKMVAKDREDRYQSMEEVIAALEGKPAEDEFNLHQAVVSPGNDATDDTTARPSAKTSSGKTGGGGGVAVATPTTVAARIKTGHDVTVREKGEKDTKREAKKKPVAAQPRRKTKGNPVSALALVAATTAVLLFGLVAGIVIWWFNRPPVLVIRWPLDERRDVRLEIDGRRKKLGADERMEFQLPPGKHKIYAARRGFLPIDEVVELGAGDRIELGLDWKTPQTPPPDPGDGSASGIGPSREQNEKELKPAFLRAQAERSEERKRFVDRQKLLAERAASQISVLDHLRRDGIDKYELKQAGAGDESTAPPELVAVLGDSRLRHTSAVHQVAFDRTNRWLAAAGHDHVVYVWDAVTGEQVQALRGHNSEVRAVAFSPTESLLASGSLDGSIRLWNPTSGAERPLLRRGAEMRVRALAFSPNGRILVSGAEDKLVRVWEVATGQEFESFEGHDGKVLAVAYSDDGKLVASCGEEGQVRVWNPATRVEPSKVAGHPRHARAVAFVPKTHWFVSGGDDSVAILWDADTGEEKQRFDWEGVQVTSLAVSPDGKTLVTGSAHGRIRLWDLETGKMRLDQDRPALSLTFSSDGETLAYCGWPPQAVSLYHLASNKERLVRHGHSNTVTGLSFSPDGRQLASSGNDHTVRLWNLSTATEERVITGHTNSVSGVAFHTTGNTLFSGSVDQTLREWIVSTGKERQTLTRPGDLIERVTAVALSPDGKTLACASADHSIRLWNLETGTQRPPIWGHTDTPVALAFSPDGRHLASAAHDKTVRLFDVAAGKHALVLFGHDDRATCLAFTRDGTMLASGGQDSKILLWDLVALTSPAILQGHPNGVLALDFSPDGKLLISSGSVAADKPADLRLWDMNRKAIIKQIPTATGSVVDLKFSPEGRHVATANTDGTIHILRVQ